MNTRFAPSPTGKLHLANIKIALLNYNAAKIYNKNFILRIDDTDIRRSNNYQIQEIKELLKNLNIDYDRSYQQSSKDYTTWINYLKNIGILYPCYETEAELMQQRTIQNKQGLPARYFPYINDTTRIPHWRFKLDSLHIESWDDKIFGIQKHKLSEASDPIVIREDGTLLYILASVIDDIEDKISIIIRGADHIANTAIQRYMWRCLDHNPDQITFAHIPLMLDQNSKPFSKRNEADSVDKLLIAGYFPEVICTSLLIPGYSNMVPKDWWKFDPFKYSKTNTKWDGCNKLQKQYLLSLSEVKGLKWLHQKWPTATIDHWNYLKHDLLLPIEIIKWRDLMESIEIYFPIEDLLDNKIRKLQIIDPKIIAQKLNISVGKASKKLRYILTGNESGPSTDLFRLMPTEVLQARFKC